MQKHHESTRTVHRLTTVVVIAGATAAAACASDSTGVRSSTQSQLAFTTGAGSLAASAALAPVTLGGHTLDLTAATLTISRAELKAAQTDSCAGDEDDDDHGSQGGQGSNHDEHQGSGSHDGNSSRGDCGELKLGSTTVDLPLGDSVVTIPANTLPAGTFRELELRVSQVELKGKFDTTSFDDTIPINAKAEIEFSTPLVVTEGAPTSVTVNVPVLSWLTNSDSTFVDPTKLSTSPTLLQRVRARILQSFRAFEDRDHDGRDDHGGR